MSDETTPKIEAADAARDKASAAARDAELKRQQDVVDAVEKANADELPKLGGPMKNPGLGR